MPNRNICRRHRFPFSGYKQAITRSQLSRTACTLFVFVWKPRCSLAFGVLEAERVTPLWCGACWRVAINYDNMCEHRVDQRRIWEIIAFCGSLWWNRDHSMDYMPSDDNLSLALYVRNRVCETCPSVSQYIPLRLRIFWLFGICCVFYTFPVTGQKGKISFVIYLFVYWKTEVALNWESMIARNFK